jgi:hypothetical protein
MYCTEPLVSSTALRSNPLKTNESVDQYLYVQAYKHFGQSPSESPPPCLGHGSSVSEDNADDPNALDHDILVVGEQL